VIATGSCKHCGADAQREQPDEMSSALAEIFDGAGLVCDACAAGERERQAEEEHELQRRLDADRFAAKVCTLPPALRRRRLHELDETGRVDALDAARRWSRGELSGLLLLGAVGVGKTTIAAATAIDLMREDLQGPTPRWISTALTISQLSRSFDSPEREDALKRLTSGRGPVILDDLDKARPSAFAAEQVFNAVDLCITHDSPLLVTTNLTPGQLASHWPSPHGEAIASRLVGYCELHEITGPDRRLEHP
jgi:DNA replication protein DnaC